MVVAGTYPFTEPAVNPSTRCFWRTKNKIMTGREAMIAPAANKPHFASKSQLNDLIHSKCVVIGEAFEVVLEAQLLEQVLVLLVHVLAEGAHGRVVAMELDGLGEDEVDVFDEVVGVNVLMLVQLFFDGLESEGS